MKQLLLTLFLSACAARLLSQAGLFNIGPAMLKKDTCSLYPLNTTLPQRQKAALIAQAETWNVSTYEISDTERQLDSSYSLGEYVRGDGRDAYKQLRDKYRHANLSEYYVMDLNRDGRLDLIHRRYYFEYEKDSLQYPDIYNNDVIFYFSTATKYFNKSVFLGRLNTIRHEKSRLVFSCIASSCCDENYTRITVFATDSGYADTRVLHILWAPYNIMYDYAARDFPTAFNKTETFVMNQPVSLGTGVYLCEGGRGAIPIKSNQPVHIFYEGKSNVLAGFVPGPGALPCMPTRQVMLLQWTPKSFFQTAAVTRIP